MSESIHNCMKFVRYMGEKIAKQNSLRPLEDAEKSRIRLNPTEAASIYRKVLIDVRSGTPVNIACKRVNAGVSGFYAWCNKQGIKLR